MTAWTLHTDPNGDRCLFHGDTAVIRPADLGPHVPPGYRQALFDLLVAVLVQDETTVVALADALHRWNDPVDPYFVIQGRPHRADEEVGDPYLPIARAALAALAPRQDAVAHVADAVGRVLPDRAARHTPPLQTRVLYQGDAVRDAVAEEVDGDE